MATNDTFHSIVADAHESVEAARRIVRGMARRERTARIALWVVTLVAFAAIAGAWLLWGAR